jgi:hypothetical protein
MTSAVDERGAGASRKFRVLLTASLLSSLIVFGPMRAETPAKMPCKLIDCRDPF